jgi:hypothetical protein
MRLLCLFLLAACSDDAAPAVDAGGTRDSGGPVADSGADAGTDAGDPVFDAGELDATMVPPGALTYLDDVHPVFEARGCSTFVCHGSVFGGSGTLLYMPDAETAYRDMIDRISVRGPDAIVRPFEPDRSVLVEHGETTLIEFGILMPEDAALVRRWVEDGAYFGVREDRDGGVPDGGLVDAEVPDGGAAPSVCSVADERGLPPLPAACLPRCVEDTWTALVMCRTAEDPVACQNAATDADPTLGVIAEGAEVLGEIDCSVCLDWQTSSCIEDACRFEFLELTRCSNLRPGDPCTAENDRLVACVRADRDFAACQRNRDFACVRGH